MVTIHLSLTEAGAISRFLGFTRLTDWIVDIINDCVVVIHYSNGPTVRLTVNWHCPECFSLMVEEHHAEGKTWFRCIACQTSAMAIAVEKLVGGLKFNSDIILRA